MARKRICVLIAQPEENTQNHFMQGFLEKAYEYDYDVCTFSMYIKYQDSTYREVGDSNIYNLINFDLFDAVVMCEDTLQTPGLAEKLKQRLVSEFAGGIVLVVDKENDTFPVVMMDHYTPIVRLVDHLIEHHGYKNIYFLSGRKGHIHSTQRLAGYKDSMKAHGLPVTDDMIYYGTYWYDSGDYMVDELMKDPEHLPDAIVCANDCMAVGVCTAFDKYGIKVPEDIAVVGYDSTEEGRNSPVPITSADIPAQDCGRYSAEYIHAKLTGKEPPEFSTNVNLFMGGTCGCSEWKDRRENSRRDIWQTDLSETGYYSCFNNLMDDLIAQTNVESFFNTVFQYVYQIRPFESFHLCMNDYWGRPDIMTGEEALRYGYTDQVYRIIKCGPDTVGSELCYDDVFKSDILLPELYEERDYPTVFMFTPLFFQDRSFGYAAVSFGREPRVYEEVYRLWLKTVCRDLEAFERHAGLTSLLAKIEAAQVRDGLTGLYNYRGFMSRVPEFIEHANREEKEILVTAIDLKNTRRVNSLYGRDEGDRLLVYVAQVISELLMPGELAMRMGNDEFVIISIAEPDDESRGDEIAQIIENKFDELVHERDSACEIGMYCAHKNGSVMTNEALESLVNSAVNAKNHMKAKAKAKAESKKSAQKPVTEEDIKRDEIVEKILDENLLTYHFQPIVSAEDGSIFAYEALMRTKGPVVISPPDLLASAERLERLYDVERYTLFNVVEIVERNEDMFRGKKVFINSMPGHMLTDEDRKLFADKVAKLTCEGIVIEFTEGDELTDEELAELKSFLSAHGIEIAIDDYGAGYSNVNNLLRYMPKYVKIDRMLLTGIDSDPHRQHFVRDIVEFTQDNDIMALAEGVETPKEMKTVIRLGTNLIQGYYTAKPNPEIIQQIPPKVANEIIQYNQSEKLTDNNKIYYMEHGGSISLLKLATDNYREIIVKKLPAEDSTVRVVGAPGFLSDIAVRIEDGFAGKLILQNASFAAEKLQPCIDCGEDSDVRLLLEGVSVCRTGGIRVPENSRLTILGDGDLKIKLSESRYYGIGNDMKSKHGVLRFRQDGGVDITANGQDGVAIGSGYGGRIQIERGRYDIQVYGQNGVAIGCVYAPVQLKLAACDMNIEFDASHGVAIGSAKAAADVDVCDSSIVIKGSGNRYTGIGSDEGDGCRFSVTRSHIEVNMRGRQCKGIGSGTGFVDAGFEDMNARLAVAGAESLAIGSSTGTGSMVSRNSDMNVTVKNGSETDIAIPASAIQLYNGRYMFALNNRHIDRPVTEEY